MGHLMPGKTRLEVSGEIDITVVGHASVCAFVAQVLVLNEPHVSCEARLVSRVRGEANVDGVVQTDECFLKLAAAITLPRLTQARIPDN